MSDTEPDELGVLPGQVPQDVRNAQAAQADADRRGPTVEELKAELKARGLATSGTKQELADRLADADNAEE